jgi:hypothetical protein
MSRQLPQKPNLEHLKKQAKELQRSAQGKLADAQVALANEYGFRKWADLKAHVQALALSPAGALTAAVCDSDAARVRYVFKHHPELRARIDDPLPDYGFAQHIYCAGVDSCSRSRASTSAAFNSRNSAISTVEAKCSGVCPSPPRAWTRLGSAVTNSRSFGSMPNRDAESCVTLLLGNHTACSATGHLLQVLRVPGPLHRDL